MAGEFERQYKETFGEDLTYDPIKPRAIDPGALGATARKTARTALDLSGLNLDDTQASGDFDADLDALMGGMKPKRPSGDTEWADYAKSAGAGAANIASSVLAIPEYAARQARERVDTPLGQTIGDFAEPLAQKRRALGQVSADIVSSMTPEAQDRLQRNWTTLDPNKTIWRGGFGDIASSVALQATNSLPSQVATLLPAALLMRAGLSPGAITYLGASEGALSLGGVAQNVAQEIEQAPEQELMQSQRYQQLRQTLGEAEARQKLIDEAQGVAPLIAGGVVGVISAVAGRYLEPIIVDGAGGFASRFGRGFVNEALQEGPQSAAEQIAQNAAAQTYDQSRTLTQGVTEQAVQGAAIGGLTGGAIVGALGRRPAPAIAGEDPASAVTDSVRNPAIDESAVDPAVQAAIAAQQQRQAEFDDPGQRPQFDPYTGQGQLFGNPPAESVPNEMGQLAPPPAAPMSPQDEQAAYLRGEYPFPGEQRQLPLTDQLATPPMNVPQEPQQLSLPIGPRARGVGRTALEPMAAAPAAAPEIVEQPSPDQQDLFAAPAPPPDNRLTGADIVRGGEPRAPRAPFVVRAYNPDGTVAIEQPAFTAERANAIADKLAGDLGEDARVMVERPRPEAAAPPVLTEMAADQPSAEPLGDLLAQLDELNDPDSPRQGVYLSADNLRRLRVNGMMDRLPATGIDIRDFDGKGGLMIARDQKVASELAQMRRESPMQEVLGFATGAGNGKPALGRFAVQQRDENGNVVRESLVADEAAAEQLAQQWDAEDPGRETVITTSTQAIRRRNRLVSAENRQAEQARTSGRVKRKVETAIEQELGEDSPVLAGVLQRDVGRRRGTESEERAANRVLARAQELGTTYDEEGNLRVGETQKSIARIAQAISPDETRKRRRLAEEQATRETPQVDAPEEFKPLTEEQVAKLEGDELQKAFRSAANANLGTGTLLYGDVQARQQRSNESGKRFRQGLIKYRPNAVIQNLKGDELNDAVAEAMAYEVSKLGDKALPKTRLADLKTDDQKREFLRDVHEEIRDARLSNMQDLENAYKAPSDKKRFINRVSSRIERTKFGGTSKRDRMSVDVAAVEDATGGERPERQLNNRGQLTATSLTDAGKAKSLKEMSAKQKADFEERVEKAFVGLKARLAKAEQLLARMENDPEFKALADRRDADNQRTAEGRRVLFARAYMRLLLQMGNALQRAGFTGRKGAVAEVERFNDVIDDLHGQDAVSIVKSLSDLYRVEERTRVGRAGIRLPPGSGSLTDPQVRALKTAEANNKLLERLQYLERLDIRSKDPTWNYGVRDIVYKMTDAIARDGWMSYAPTEAESALLQTAMKLWRKEAKLDIYDPMRRLLRGIGYAFDEKGVLVMPTDANGKYQWRQSDDALNARVRRKLGTKDAERQEAGVVISEIAREAWTPERANQYIKEIREGIDAEYRRRDGEPLSEAQLRNLTDLQVVNTAIRTLRQTIENERTSIPEMVRAEQQFIAQMKATGNWTDRKGGTAAVRLPTLSGRVIERTIRPVSQQLQTNEMTKAEARQIVLDLYKEVPLSLEMQEVADIAKAAANTFRKVARKVDTEAQKSLGPDQRAVLRSLRERGMDLRLDMVERIDDPALVPAAQAAADLLEVGEVNFQTLLDTVDLKLPKDHPYRALVERLSKLDLSRYSVAYGTDEEMQGAAGQHFQKSGLIQINRDLLAKRRDAGKDPHGVLLHAFMHEAVHAATVTALKENGRVRVAMSQLLTIAKRELGRQGLDNLYGLKDPYEFVAEAFSNADFQRALKRVKLDRSDSVWDAFVKLVRRLLGLDNDPTPGDGLEAVMMLTDQLFVGDKLGRSTLGREAARGMRLDGVTLPIVGDALDRMRQSTSVMQRLRESSAGLLPVTTMDQISRTYRRYFDAPGGNPLDAYIRAYRQRNADNSKSMERATQLSRDWTTMTEQKGVEKMLEMSRIMTESTLYGMHPDRAWNDPANAHLRGADQRERHMKLAARFKRMDEEVQDLYRSVQDYYDKTYDTEVALLTLNALRAYLTKGKDAPLDDKTFDEKYGDESIVRKKRLDTIEGLKAEFGSMIDDDALKTIRNIASVREHTQGPYFPLMRFGDFVVEATRVVETKEFSSYKDARVFQNERRGDDPTIDVRISEKGGKYVATVAEKELVMAESRSEAEAKRRELVAKYGKDADVTPVQLKQDLFRRDATIPSNSALSTILGKLEGNPAAQAAMKNFYLQSIADSSFRKRELGRKNRLGVDYDTQHRTFATYAKQSAYYTAQLRFGWRMGDALARMQTVVKNHRDESEISAVRMGEVLREINTRDKLTTDPYEASKVARKGVELGHFMLLTSPSYWMLNATQPWMVTMPWLSARYGLPEATAALGRAQKLLASPLVSAAGESWGGLAAFKGRAAADKAFGVLDQIEPILERRGGARGKDYVRMIQDLKRDSIIDMSFVAEIRDIAEGEQYGFGAKVLDASRILSHLTEVNNRVMTAIAAYDLARDRNLPHETAVAIAQEAVSVTQFDYSAGNKPRLFTAQGPLGNAGPLVFQFLQYPQHIYAMLIDGVVRATRGNPQERKVALRTLAGLVSTHLLAGGVIGAMVQPAKWALGLILAAMGGDDDEPYTLKGALSGDNFDRWMRGVNADLFGVEFGQVVSKGLPITIGADLSTRMSLGQVYQIDLKTDNATSFLGSLVGSFGGPAVGLLEQGIRGVDYFGQGEFSKAAEAFLPKVGKDVLKAIRYTNEGVTNAKGEVIQDAKDFSPWELFLQTIGFSPASTGEIYARNAARKDAQTYGRDKRQSLINRWVRSPDDRVALSAQIAEFNQRFPAEAITRSDLIKSNVRREEAGQRLREFGGNFRGREQLYGTAYEDVYNVDEDDIDEE